MSDKNANAHGPLEGPSEERVWAHWVGSTHMYLFTGHRIITCNSSYVRQASFGTIQEKTLRPQEHSGGRADRCGEPLETVPLGCNRDCAVINS